MTNIRARQPYSRRPSPQGPLKPFLDTELANIQRGVPVPLVRAVFADDTVQASDDTIEVDATAGAVSITLPPPDRFQFLRVTVIRVDDSASAVIVSGDMGGATTVALRVPGDVLVVQSDGSTWLVLQSPLPAIFDVTRYGAVGDGVHDDTEAIQDAIDAASVVAGDVRIPSPGTYKITRQTGVLSGMSAGVLGASLLLASDVTIQADRGAVLVQSSANTDAFYGATLTDVALLNVAVTGLGGSDQGNAAELFSITRVNIEGCTVEDIGESAGVGGGGFVLTGCDQIEVVDNRGTDCGYAFINLFRCTNFSVAWNTHENTRGTSAGPVTCVYIDAASGQTADGSVSNNNAIANNYSYQVRGNVTRVAFTGNSARGELGVGITVQSVGADLASFVTLVANPIQIAAAGLGGINFDGAADCSASNNPISGPATVAGINVNQTGALAPTRIAITSNNVGGASAFGILVSAGTDVSVDENTVNCPTSGQRSIALTGGSKHKCDGNRIVAANFHAIDNTTNDTAIRGNLIDGTTNGGDGVRSSGTGCQITDNMTRGTIAGTPFTISGAGTYRRGNSITSGARSGQAVLVAGTVTVSTTEVIANDNIILSTAVPGGTQGNLSYGSIVAGTSFAINSTSATDTSTIFWEIVH